MQPLTRTAARSAQRLRPQITRQAQRRYAGDHHGPELVSEGQGVHKTHPPKKTESLGSGFFIALAAIPVSLALYKITSPGKGEEPFFTRYITNTYARWGKQWADRNDLHTQAMQQAAADRVLFMNEANQQPTVLDHRFVEGLNGGSPWNVRAGHGGADLSELIAKYEKEAFEDNEKKLQQLRNNKVPVEQPVQHFRKLTAAANDS